MKIVHRISGWGLPLTIVVALHLGLALIPLQFAEVSSAEPPPIRLSLFQPPEPAPIVEPPPVVEEPLVEEPPKPVIAQPKKRTPKPRPVIEAPEPAAEQPAIAAIEAPSTQALEQEVIETEIPVEESVEVADVVEPSPAPAPTPEPVDMRGYGMGVMQSVNGHKSYPRMAERMKMEGVATVRIRINRDGSLADRPHIVSSTSHDLLDEEVLRMATLAAPYSPLPAGFDKSEAEFVIPIRFSLSRN